MAKTRIKNTPTRMQKDAIMGSTTVTTATTVCKSGRGGPEDTLKKRLLQLSQKNTNTTTIDLTASDSTIIVHAPKRTNSISSATSTLSHISDGCQSDSEFISLASPTPPITTPSPPRSARAATSNAMSLTPPSTIIDAMEETELKSEEPTMDELTENAIKTLNAGLQSRVMNGRSALAAAIKNRKVFMITEKNDHANHLNADSHGYNMQKRKMYLIMEENHDNDNDHHQQSNQEKWLKMDNGNAANAKSIGNCKKLTLFADKCDGQLPQQIEKILPEILHRIQAKNHDNSIIVSPNHLANTNGNTNAPTNTNLFTTKANATDRICAMGNLNTNANVNTISAGIDRTIINTDSNDSDEILFNHEMNHFNHQSIVKHDNHDDSKFIIFKTENNSDTNNTNNNNNNNNERLPLTLPPKKNRNKIINTQIIPVVMPQQQQQQQHQHQHQNTDTNNQTNNFIRIENTNNFNHTNNKNNGVTNSVIYENLNGAAMTTITAAPPTVQPTAAGVTVVKTLPRIFRKSEDELNILTEEIMGATPVIVAPKQLQQQQQQQRQSCKTIGPSIKALPITAITAAPTTPTTAIKPINIELYNGNNNGTLTNVRNAERMPSHKNINLSPDFLFLMKMLPKLESVPEPQKTHLKNCIEQIITQNSNKFGCDE